MDSKQMTAMTKTVEVREGLTVTIGRATWTLWKTLKTKVLEALMTEDFKKSLHGILESAQKSAGQGLEAEQITVTVILANIDKSLATTIPNLLAKLSDVLDEMTDAIVLDAILSGNGRKEELAKQTIDSFSARDYIVLRDASSELNDWKGMFAAEKNSFMALMPNLLDGPETESDLTGGQDGSLSSLSTAGVGQTSGSVQPAKSSNTSSSPEEPSLAG